MELGRRQVLLGALATAGCAPTRRVEPRPLDLVETDEELADASPGLPPDVGPERVAEAPDACARRASWGWVYSPSADGEPEFGLPDALVPGLCLDGGDVSFDEMGNVRRDGDVVWLRLTTPDPAARIEALRGAATVKMGSSAEDAVWEALGRHASQWPLALQLAMVDDTTRLAAVPKLDAISMLSIGASGHDISLLDPLEALSYVELSCGGGGLTDAELRSLLERHPLRDVHLLCAAVTTLAPFKGRRLQGLSIETPYVDDGFDVLPDLTDLATLSLSLTRLGRNVKLLEGLTELRELSLIETGLDDTLLQHISGLVKLRRLALNGNLMTGAGVSRLRDLKSLRWLRLAATDIRTDDTLEGLEAFAYLERLDLQNTLVGDAAADRIAGLANFRQLNLTSTTIGDAGVKALSRLPELRVLALENTAVTAKGVLELAGTPSLRRLYADLDGIGMRRADQKKLQAALPDCFIF